MKNFPPNDVTYYDDFRAMLCGLAQRYSDSTALTCFDRKGNETNYSYNALLGDTEAFCEALCMHKLAGKNIAIVGANSYEWLVGYFGAATSGGIAVCIDTEQSDETVCKMILHADSSAILVSREMLPVIAPVLESVELVIVMNSHPEPYISINDFIKKGRESIAHGGIAYKNIAIDKHQAAAIVYTSGTTSTAKPVMLSHYAICTNTADALTLVAPSKKVFAALPFYHAYGMMCAVLSALNCNTGIGINGDIKTMLRNLALYNPGVIVAVPLMAETIHKMIWDEIEKSGRKKTVVFFMKLFRLIKKPMLLRKTLLKKLDSSSIGSLDMMLCGGAYLSKEVGEDLVSFGIAILQGYGITECSPTVSVNSNHDFDVRSVGHILPHFEVKTKDSELLVRGASLMNGYYKNEALTRQAFDDGWFKTGDLGYINKRGHLVITGRKKTLIILKNGKKIPAEEIETHFYNVALVKEVIAYGATSGARADDVKLAVMVYPDPQTTAGMTSYEILEGLQSEVDKLNATLPSYKQIQMVNIRQSEFEKTASRKIKRQII